MIIIVMMIMVSHCNIVSENDKDSRKQSNTYDGDEQYVK